MKRVPLVVQATQNRIEQLLAEGEQKAVVAIERLKGQLAVDTEVIKRVIHQVQQRLQGVNISGKIYSLHEPHVSCIRNGKRARPDEYGTKVTVSIDHGGYLIDHREFATNPMYGAPGWGFSEVGADLWFASQGVGS